MLSARLSGLFAPSVAHAAEHDVVLVPSPGLPGPPSATIAPVACAFVSAEASVRPVPVAPAVPTVVITALSWLAPVSIFDRLADGEAGDARDLDVRRAGDARRREGRDARPGADDRRAARVRVRERGGERQSGAAAPAVPTAWIVGVSAPAPVSIVIVVAGRDVGDARRP